MPKIELFMEIKCFEGAERVLPIYTIIQFVFYLILSLKRYAHATHQMKSTPRSKW